jgi:hypothetical protein
VDSRERQRPRGPRILAFLVGVDGTVESSLMDGKQYQAGGFSTWLRDEIKAYERAHPRTRLPFVLAEVEKEADRYSCSPLSSAHEDGKHVLLFFGREREAPDVKGAKRELKRTRSFAKKVLDAKTAEKEAGGFVFLRFDVGDPEHAAYARQLAVEEVPTLLLWSPGVESPIELGRKISPVALAMAMKKAKAASTSETSK